MFGVGFLLAPSPARWFRLSLNFVGPLVPARWFRLSLIFGLRLGLAFVGPLVLCGGFACP